MEKVFWLMWLSDVAGSISMIGTISLIALISCAAFLLIIAGLDADEWAAHARSFRVGWWLIIPIAIACVVPSKQTIQVLAVASATEAAASTQLGAKGLEALNAVLDKVVKEAKK